ncbi:oxaloacetate decarboxylase alpha subunit [termite gut metagenome]|uniref:Oxaloacetate decarboxylase alpha subunit n=1 Tax=termite gut metagenome TaxID=433724 RepID=A0A5J4SI51_9ZZZZ
MEREIKFALVYRDMWQSSGKYQPRKDQLERVAPLIIEMDCFARVETNGGAFEQVNLLYGENPNEAVRAFTKPFHEAGIQTQMLDRSLNGIRMYPVPGDVRRLMYKVKYAQGVDITRIFCGLNDVRNIIPSIKYAIEGGMIPQATLCITHSPVHTVEYYVSVADKLVEMGAKEICLKDMAGIGRPGMLGRLTKAIKEKYPEIIVQYHGHSGPGLSPASILEVCENGADIIDVAMEPLSWGKVHPDVISVQAMLKDKGFWVPEINMKAYMKVRAMTQEFMDDFLGYFIDPTNKHTSSLLLSSGLPGGMMGSMMADLKGVHSGINMILQNSNRAALSLDDLLLMLFEEVEYVWPKLGYPPLVTPFSQYVKNVALMNVMASIKGEERWTMIDNHTWGMILGKDGKLPGVLDPEIIELAHVKGFEFSDEDPQKNYPDELDAYRKEMRENGWDFGEDEEELFELAMHDRQYRDYKSGVAKKRFEDELQRAKDVALCSSRGFSAEELRKYKRAKAEPLIATAKGQVLWEIDVVSPSQAPFVGKKYKEEDVFCYIVTIWGYEEIKTGFGGRVVEICCKQGEMLEKGEILGYVEREK